MRSWPVEVAVDERTSRVADLSIGLVGAFGFDGGTAFFTMATASSLVAP
jgi:hypothetical protein